MKKFSRMPKSEGGCGGGGGGGGGAAGGGAGGAGVGSGSGSSSVGVRVFAVGRYQVTLEESLAEGREYFNRIQELISKLRSTNGGFFNSFPLRGLLRGPGDIDLYFGEHKVSRQKFVEGEVPFQLASLKQQRKNNVAAPLSFLSLLALYFSLFSKGGRVK